MGADFYLEDADEIVFEDLVVMGFVGDFDFVGRIGSEEDRGEQEREEVELHHWRHRRGILALGLWALGSRLPESRSAD